MNGAFQIAGVGLQTQQKALDIVANNIANMNTQGFKRSDVQFSSLMAREATQSVPGAALGGGARSAGLTIQEYFRVGEQGQVEPTGNPLDLAIDGEGFIELMGPNGQSLLWRGGTLEVSPNGLLSAGNGFDLKALISIPFDATDLEVRQDGRVLGRLGGDTNVTELGQISLVQLEGGSNTMQRLDGGIYEAPLSGGLIELMPGEDGAGLIVQGALERSTVDLNTEMVDLMVVQRAYAANAQIVQAADQIMSIANNLRR